jgi:uncharacterized protein YdhG (YjbR/CyaY superfamily)
VEKTRHPNVNAYMANLPPDRRAALESIRALMREIAPDAAEAIHYGMPCYDLKGMLFCFASQKHYMSLYVIELEVLQRHKAELKGLSVAKSCIRFRSLEQLPMKTIRAILREAVEARRARA